MESKWNQSCKIKAQRSSYRNQCTVPQSIQLKWYLYHCSGCLNYYPGRIVFHCKGILFWKQNVKSWKLFTVYQIIINLTIILYAQLWINPNGNCVTLLELLKGSSHCKIQILCWKYPNISDRCIWNRHGGITVEH